MDDFRGLAIETPLCGHGDVFARIDDAAVVHRLAGAGGAVTVQLPTDAVEDYEHLHDYLAARGLRAGTVAADRIDDEFAGIAGALGSGALALSLGDDLRPRSLEALGRVYARLPGEQELLVGGDWGAAVLTCQKLGARAKVLVDCAQGANVERIVTILAGEGRLGGLRVTGAVNPFDLFAIFVELAAGEALPRLAIGSSPGVEAVVSSVVGLQEAYAKARLVDREALREAQEFGDALGARELLLDAFRTDVRPWCAGARAVLGAVENPIVALRQSDYVER